jgi:hypothetical protein
MGILTDRLNSVQRRTTWRMSHEDAIINTPSQLERHSPLAKTLTEVLELHPGM